jgi:hypothetical protein
VSGDEDFSDRLAVFCALRGITCTDMARMTRANMSQTSRWLRGLNMPRDRAFVVRRTLGMSLAEFYAADLADAKVRLRKARVAA